MSVEQAHKPLFGCTDYTDYDKRLLDELSFNPVVVFLNQVLTCRYNIRKLVCTDISFREPRRSRFQTGIRMLQRFLLNCVCSENRELMSFEQH